MTHHCRALFVGAPASGQGKTTATAALARHYRDRGLRVRAFKTGPDFLDPTILERATGAPVHQLDLWMVGEEACRTLLHEAAGEADVILVEGAMGLFDGTPSGADLAAAFGLSVLAVIDGAAVAETFGAIALGLDTYRDDIALTGTLAQRVGSPRHAEMLAGSLPDRIRWWGHLPRREPIALPSRHLGLVVGEEVDDLDQRLDAGAAALGENGPLPLPPEVAFAPAPVPAVAPALAGVRIGVARDAAFPFIYPANLDVLERLGAELHFFSPLSDTALPKVDAVWLPGGYPELYLETLAANTGLREALRRHHDAGRPLLAECGGLLYCLETLTDADGRSGAMAGLLPGTGRLRQRLAGLGLQALELPEGEIRGHTFHYSQVETTAEPVSHCRRVNGTVGEAVYRDGRLLASYVHLYFPTNPEAIAALFLP